MVTSILPRVMQDGRTVPTPQVHALILAALDLQPGQKVLEIGTGSGTTARELAGACCECQCDSCKEIPMLGEHRHCGTKEPRIISDGRTQGACYRLEVHTIELLPVYGEVLDHDALDVYFHAGDGKLGLKTEAPFDAIVATYAVERLPEAWGTQLREGGKLVVPLGAPAAQRLVLMTKERGVLKLQRVLAYVRFSVMRELPR